MQQRLMKIGRIFERGAVQTLASFPGPCASSGGRLPEARFMVCQLDSKSANVSRSCRSRQDLSNEYLLAKFGVDTAENGPLKVCQKLAKS